MKSEDQAACDAAWKRRRETDHRDEYNMHVLHEHTAYKFGYADALAHARAENGSAVKKREEEIALDLTNIALHSECQQDRDKAMTRYIDTLWGEGGQDEQ